MNRARRIVVTAVAVTGAVGAATVAAAAVAPPSPATADAGTARSAAEAAEVAAVQRQLAALRADTASLEIGSISLVPARGADSIDDQANVQTSLSGGTQSFGDTSADCIVAKDVGLNFDRTFGGGDFAKNAVEVVITFEKEFFRPPNVTFHFFSTCSAAPVGPAPLPASVELEPKAMVL